MEVAQTAPRQKSCADTLFMLEDKVLKNPGLYLMWCLIFFANIIVLALDETTGPARDFNIISSILSTVYLPMSSINNVYGSGKPSFGLITVGPVHQYSTWMLLAYYRGSVYGTNSLGVMNGIYTVVVGVFTLDMFIKTWYGTLYTKQVKDYLNDKDN